MTAITPDHARAAVDVLCHVVDRYTAQAAEIQRLREAKEAFLNLFAGARKFDEQPDENETYYTIETTDRSLEPLLKALGIAPQPLTIWVDSEPFPGRETLVEALERENNTPTALTTPNQSGAADQ